MFDPKTRPSSIYWDSRALMTAPAPLAAASGFTTFWWSFMMLGGIERCNPLSQADRLQSFIIAHRALPRMVEEDAAARIEMCAASFLQNRDEDSGGGLLRFIGYSGSAMRSDLAFLRRMTQSILAMSMPV